MVIAMAQSTSTSRSVTDTSTSYMDGYMASTSLDEQRRQAQSRTVSRPGTRMSRRTAASTIGGGENQEIICAISEARGATSTVGLAFINLSTSEVVISQICDNAFYARTVNKIRVFEPTEILMMTTAAEPNSTSKMFSIVKENCEGSPVQLLERKYWSETTGLEYIQYLAFAEDVETLKVSIGGNYYATCCLAAALKYIEVRLGLSFSCHSLRIKYQPSEGTMMIDLSTIKSLELIQNLQNSKSKDCLFGLLDETLTPMGSRCLRSNLLQPSTEREVLDARYDTVEELASREEMFFTTRQALKPFPNVDKLLTNLVLIPLSPDIRYAEQSINNILSLKSFVQAVGPLYDAVSTARSFLLEEIARICHPDRIRNTIKLIDQVINQDVSFAKRPLDLRNQRTYAVKSGVNGLLDVARQTFKEATEDVHKHVTATNDSYNIQAQLEYDTARRYYLRILGTDIEDREIPAVLINRYRKKKYIECQTLDMIKLNQRIEDSHQEAVLMSDKVIQALLDDIRGEMSVLFKVCESIAMLDMLTSFAHLVTTREYIRPEITKDFAIKAGKHPIREKNRAEKFVPNDFYATKQTRFQILTGCNMSGKSTYIHTIALLTIMAQVGSFIPAVYASIPLTRQLFARISTDDSSAANISTFASEMRETAYILRNIDSHSIAIIDELGRGTSTRDGLAIALAIAEALIDSHALVWFVTHFREVAQILNERIGVVNMHLKVDMTAKGEMAMLYKRVDGLVTESHYGIALAREVGLPKKVLDVATDVAAILGERAKAKKVSSEAYAIVRRRKVVLGLGEALRQAAEGPLEGEVLLAYLRKLQLVFVRRMEEIEKDREGEGGIEEVETEDEDEVEGQESQEGSTIIEEMEDDRTED